MHRTDVEVLETLVQTRITDISHAPKPRGRFFSDGTFPFRLPIGLPAKTLRASAAPVNPKQPSQTRRIGGEAPLYALPCTRLASFTHRIHTMQRRTIPSRASLKGAWSQGTATGR